MENTSPYLGLPIEGQHSTTLKDNIQGNDFQQMAPSSSQNIMNFLPPFPNTSKGSMDLHGLGVATSESIQAEDLQSSFKMNETCNLMLDPFLSEQQLNAGVVDTRHNTMHESRHPSMNVFSSANSMLPSSANMMAPSMNCLATSVASDQQSSHSAFSRTMENPLNVSSDFHNSFTHIPQERGHSFQNVGGSMAPGADSKLCDIQIGLQDLDPSINCQTDNENLNAEDSFLCNICNHKFVSEDELSDHIRLAHNGPQDGKRDDYIFTCSFCPKAFKTQENLSKHEARHPYGTSAIQCSKCGEILGNYLLFQEHKQYEDYLSSCDICGQLFPNEECMICHIRNAHNDFEDIMDEELSAPQVQEESTGAASEDASSSHGCLSEEISADMDEQNNIVHEKVPSNNGFAGEIRLSPTAQEPSSEASLVQNDSMSMYEEPQNQVDGSNDSESFQESMINPPSEGGDVSNSDPVVQEGSAPETETVVEEVQLESGGEQSPAEGNDMVSEYKKPEKMQCRYCTKKCSTRKSLIRHERCHPYETAVMKCYLCLEVVDNYKSLKIHKKKLSQVSCSICSQLCPNELCLLCHVRNVHDNIYGVKPIYSVSDDSNDEYNVDEDEDGSDDDFATPRYATRNAPLRMTIKQENESDEAPNSPTFSASTPPTPATPYHQGPNTPSPPSFVPESEPSEEDDEYEPNASDGSVGGKGEKTGKRKSTTRSTRKSSINSVQISSSDGSDRDESGDNYSPEGSASEEESEEDWRQEEVYGVERKKRRRKNPISEEDSEEDPDWGRSRNTSSGSKKRGRRKKGLLSDDSDEDLGWRRSVPKISVVTKKKRRKKKSAMSDDDSDNDPDWRKAESGPVVVKKKGTGKRGRPKKVQVAFFVPAIPIPKKPRAKGLVGQKAHDAAAALAQAVEDMETTAPELKTVIRPVRRSVTKASLKRYCEIEDDEYDYPTHVKQEPNDGPDDSDQVQVSQEEGSNEMFNSQDADEIGERIVVKAEPFDFQDDDDDESTDLYFSQKFCETKFDSKHKLKKQSSGELIKREGYACKLCGRAMQYRSHLIRHLRKVHDGEGVEEVMRRMMHCRFCSKAYTNELSLINHEKLHDGTSKMKCNKCEERFDDKNALRRHQRKTHWEHQPVECEICKKQLSDNTCLKAHMKHMHGSEEKKVTIFTCETCGRQLHTKTAFQNHVASKCGTNLLFPCETCGKSFSFKGSLKAHQLLHTGIKSFLCKFCGKAFHQKGEMKRHERKHTGEKPFICEVCGRAFAYRESLLGHSAIHTGIKPFPCKSCGMRFSCSGNLVKHRRSNNCKGVLEPGINSVDQGSENPEENARVNQAGVAVNLPTSGVLPDGSPKSLQPDARVMLNNGQHLEYQKNQEPLQNLVSQVQNQPMNQGPVASSASMSCTSNIPSNTTMSVSRHVSNATMPASNIASNTPMSVPRSAGNVTMPVCLSVSGASMSATTSGSNVAMQVSAASESPHMTSVIKSAPSINVKSTSALQGMPKESRQSSQVEALQSHGGSASSNNRLPAHLNTMYNNHENSTTPQTNYGSHNLAGSYSDGHFRQSNQINVNDRRFMQFSMDSYAGRTDQYFDRQALMRHEMNRQVMERTADRSQRFLDWTGGVQFSGMDSRGSLQSYPTATISHSSGYPGHLGNYAASHATSHSNNHANVYGSNSMMPGGVSFPAFAASNPIGMGYTPNNPIPAHSVAHPSSYPASHMSHLEALFGHFSHAGGSNSFPRLSSHNAGSPANPSLPSNHRV